MTTPIEICLENIDLSEEDERYLRCVALPDAEPGLALDPEGEVIWMPEEQATSGFWVSGDEQLILIRAEGTATIWAERAGRSVEAPAGKPVVLLDQDLLRIGNRRLRVHVHGPTEDVYPPEPVPPSALGRLARSAATAIALGATTLSGPAAAGQSVAPGNLEPIEVRARPPKRAAPRHPVNCEIKSIMVTKAGIVVQARCPAGTRLFKGMRGVLLSADKQPIPDGKVTVKSVVKNQVVAEGHAHPEAKATHIRFMIHD